MFKKKLFHFALIVVSCLSFKTNSFQKNILIQLSISTLEIPQQKNDYHKGMKLAQRVFENQQIRITLWGSFFGCITGLFTSMLASHRNGKYMAIGSFCGTILGGGIGYGISSSDWQRNSIFSSYEKYAPLNTLFQNLCTETYHYDQALLDLLIASDSCETFIKQVQIEYSLKKYPLLNSFDKLSSTLIFSQKAHDVLSMIMLQHTELTEKMNNDLKTYQKLAKNTVFLLKQTLCEYKEHPAYTRELNEKMHRDIQETQLIKLKTDIKTSQAKEREAIAKSEKAFAETVDTWTNILFE